MQEIYPYLWRYGLPAKERSQKKDAGYIRRPFLFLRSGAREHQTVPVTS